MRSSHVVGVMVGTVLAVASLTGCGKFYWGKAGATQQEFDRDNLECTKESAPTPAAAGFGIVYERLYRTCLSARGWTRAQHPDPAPPGWYRGIE